MTMCFCLATEILKSSIHRFTLSIQMSECIQKKNHYLCFVCSILSMLISKISEFVCVEFASTGINGKHQHLFC